MDGKNGGKIYRIVAEKSRSFLFLKRLFLKLLRYPREQEPSDLWRAGKVAVTPVERVLHE